MCENDTQVAYDCDRLYGNQSSEMMETCYLEQCFIPKRVPYSLSVPLTSIYTIVFVLGLMGNFLTTIAILFSKSLLVTTTAKYLLNLAIADMVTLISGIPFEVLLLWNQYPWLLPDFVCNLSGGSWNGRNNKAKLMQKKFFRSVFFIILSILTLRSLSTKRTDSVACALETTYYVSALTILAFAFERYLAVCHVLFIRKIVFYQRHLDKLLISCWGLAVLSSIPYGINHKADYLVDKWPPRSDYGPLKLTKVCMLPLTNNDMVSYLRLKILFHASAFVYFLLPFFVISVLYWRIQKTFKSQLTNGHSRGQLQRLNSTKDGKTHKKVWKILVSVVVVFFTCYAPFQAQRLVFFYVDDPQLLPKINEYLYIISGILFYLSGVLNPFLYNLISPKYRLALKTIFKPKNSPSMKFHFETAV